MSDPCKVQVMGPLAGYVVGWRVELAGRGYSPDGATSQLQLMAHVSWWLGEEGLAAGDLSPDRAGQFLVSRRRLGYTQLLSSLALVPLLGYLRDLGVAPEAVEVAPTDPVEVLLARFGGHLVGYRQLAPSTVSAYVGVARLFLSSRAALPGMGLACLTAREVMVFVERGCRGRRCGYAKGLVTGLRSLLRFLHGEGLIGADLAAVVPAVASWRDASLPRTVDAGQVAALLASCDRASATGLRDYAILSVLSRLGLRAGEVAAARLDDFDWRHGEMVVHSKGGRLERMPLPVDVGDAVVAYLAYGRPPVGCRAVFLRVCAPTVGLGPVGVATVVGRACERAGLPVMGAHRLRHFAATEMLWAGASFSEVGQVLRHASVSTTAIYAKVDLGALSGLAQRWPGGAA